MARVLIVGCGCRGRALAGALRADGHAVRGTTRAPEKLAAIEAAGAEPWLGDPGRIGTLTGALESVTVVCWMLAGAWGPAESVAALHGTRLQTFCRGLVDTTVRGLVYEAAGSVGEQRLAGGRAIVEQARQTWELPVRTLQADPGDWRAWAAAAHAAVDDLLGGPRPPISERAALHSPKGRNS